MRLLTFIVSLLAFIAWICVLVLGIDYFDFVACVSARERPITGELLHWVALPFAMTSLSIALLILAIVRKPTSKIVFVISLVSFASIGIYASFTGLAVSEPTLSICSR